MTNHRQRGGEREFGKACRFGAAVQLGLHCTPVCVPTCIERNGLRRGVARESVGREKTNLDNLEGRGSEKPWRRELPGGSCCRPKPESKMNESCRTR